MRRPAEAAALCALGLLVAPYAATLSAQHQPRDSASALSLSLGVGAIGVVTRVAPGVFGRELTEGYLTQPIFMAHLAAAGGRVGLRASIDFEGLTLERGELNTGTYGEGYVDRRHPHTYLHEALAEARTRVGGVELSLAAGKGFAPFGTDDPMVRPFVKYPVNHHLAQVLERLVAIGAVRVGPLALEGGFFNGDEPTSAGTAPRASRFGDSWAVRATLSPLRGVELASSHARVESPEERGGAGLDQRKLGIAARIERAGPGVFRYALVEWARTDELFSGQPVFRFATALGEASFVVGGLDLAARLERTTRPEEERLENPFRTARPLADFNILGITRWDAATVAVSVPRSLGRAGVRVTPFAEASLLRPKQVTRPSAFVPEEFYGASRIWNLSLGIRVAAGRMHRRMGRYGAALGAEPAPGTHSQ